MEYRFALKFVLPASPRPIDEFVGQLGEAGCGGASVTQARRIALEFAREADSAESAILSALATVRAVIPGAQLLEVTPDFVGLSDIARCVGVSRQNMRKLMLTHTAHFPIPVHEGSAALWHLAPVLAWLRDRAGYAIPATLLEVAHIAMQVNLAKEACQIERSAHSERMELLASAASAEEAAMTARPR